MELMKAGSLKQFISFRKNSNLIILEEEASQIMRCLLSAVEYMHSKNIIHRDLKPENILLNDFSDLNSVKIGDFGLSFKLDNEITFHKMISQKCGTYIFMAPEQIKGHQYSKPVDLWPCGIIMFMLLTQGKHPYPEATSSKDEYAEFIQTSPTFQIDSSLSNKFRRMSHDLLLRLICPNQFERYSAGQALIHPWITRCFTDQIPMNIEERISMFQKQEKFSQVDRKKRNKILFYYQLLKLLTTILYIKKKIKNNGEWTREYQEEISPHKKSQQIKFQNRIYTNINKLSSPQIIRKKNSNQFHFNLIKLSKQRNHSTKYNQSMHENCYSIKTQNTQSHSQDNAKSKESAISCKTIIDQYIEQRSLKTFSEIKLPSIHLKKQIN